MSDVAPVPAFGALALHGLAHLPLAGVASLYDATYVGWARAALGVGAVEPLAEDAPRIAAEVNRAGAELTLSWLPRLHRDLDAALRVAAIDLADLGEPDVADPQALRVLRAIDPVGVEWLRADLALIARAFDAARKAHDLERACERLSRALELAPSALRPEVVRVDRALGRRGRAYSDAVWVGAPDASERDAETIAVVALHEEAVRRAPGDHAHREWRALLTLARGLEGSALAPAHAAWLATLDLGSVVDDPGLGLDVGLRAALRARPSERAARLRGLADDR
ncbi:MAG: hypothetical protein U0234_06410 [Sandaracinus sp.]